MDNEGIGPIEHGGEGCHAVQGKMLDEVTKIL